MTSLPRLLDPCSVPPPTTQGPVVVAIPARDEEERVGRTLQALGQQLREDRSTLRVLLLVNNCRDDTAAVARRLARTLPVELEVIEENYPAEDAHVGRARGRALELAAARLGGHPDGLLLTTDADTVAAPDWVERMRAALAQADVVGGRILTLPEERVRLTPAVRRVQLQDAAYHLLCSQLESRLNPDPADPWPRHHQHFGANLGLRLSAWVRLGAWPPVRCLEDVALVTQAQRLDLRVRHCPGPRVWTSARACGRVDTGLSTQLREWEELQAMGHCWLVPGAAEREAQALACAELARVWAGPGRPGSERQALEERWMVGPGALHAALAAPTLGLARDLALQARNEAGHWWRHYPAVPVDDALRDLRARLSLPAAPVRPLALA